MHTFDFLKNKKTSQYTLILVTMQAGECYTYPRVGNMYETARHNIVYGGKKTINETLI